jgi:peroxiredoxin
MSKTHPNEPIMIQVGDIAPDFELMGNDNHTHTLSAASKPIVLVFYRGDW